MTEKDKYAEIYGQPRRVTAEDRAAFRRIWHKIWGDDLAYELAPTNFVCEMGSSLPRLQENR